ncbi:MULTISPECIES: hypothetical protein [unclassified Bradyrhizobium]
MAVKPGTLPDAAHMVFVSAEIAETSPLQRNIWNPVFGVKHAERLLIEAAIVGI